MTVSLSEDSFFSPGQTFAIPIEHLSDAQATPMCAPSACANLPAIGTVQGYYSVIPKYAADVGWNLGNPGLTTELPVHVTYRALWPPTGPAASAVDAESIGLPLAPLVATVVVDQTASRLPGPNGGLSIGFLAEVQPGLYERTIAPDSPFDRAFPPDVERVTVVANGADDRDQLKLDSTMLEPPGSPMYPTFDISRSAGRLDGWSAYLRDATTRRRLSPAVPLSGATTKGVLLPTNHHPSDMDALTNTQLVLEPPADEPVPTGVFSLQGGQIARAETYPELPNVVIAGGVITDVDGKTPVEADLFFEATAIDTISPTTPGPVPNAANFEYTVQVSARVDSMSGASVWSAALPPGQYRLTARPLDTSHTVTIAYPCPTSDSNCFEVAAPPAAELPAIWRLATQPTIQGKAELSDGRPLAGATVDAVPSQCAVGQSPYCLPRAAQATTEADGSFALSLDHGSYWLRVEPNDGTGFPWVLQPLVVGPTRVPLSPVVVPAPVYAGRSLADPHGNPIVNALVRVYKVSSPGASGTPGGAVEVGRALTDAGGHFDLYLAPQ
jgi:hypothetical protein